jgi:D-3-phosphoglycerate dehydrogenase / 2-oxoglutarate reductase
MNAPGKRTVLVTGESLVPDDVLRLIEKRGFTVRWVAQEAFTAAELHRALDGVSGYLIGGHERPLPEHFEAADRLEAVAWVGTDYAANVPGWRRAYELGIAFINAPGANADSVTEFTMLLMLSLARPFTEQIRLPGRAVAPLGPPGRELRGSTLGLIGAGRVGALVAAGASAGFGMRVRYSAPRRKPELEASTGAIYSGRDELLAVSDVISLHRPGPAVDEPAELGRRELELLKPGTLLINTVHPGLVDPVALLRVARARGVRAAFDGIGAGPAWDDLAALGPRLFLGLTQMGYHTADANRRASLCTATSVCDVLDGLPASWVNNPDYRERRSEAAPVAKARRRPVRPER